MASSQPITIRNRCSLTAITPIYQELLEAVIAAYVGLWPDRLIEVRLLGSIARWEAIDGVSDMDAIGLLAGPPAPEDVRQLEATAAALGYIHRAVTRVELEAVSIEDISPYRRLVLSSDSVSVSGDDRFTRPVQKIDRTALAHLVTPDAAALVHGYRQAVDALDATTEADVVRFWSRIVGKDLLKSLRFVILMRGGDYEVGIVHIAQQASVFVPEFADFAECLFALYAQPTDDRQQLTAALQMAETTLLPALERYR